VTSSTVASPASTGSTRQTSPVERGLRRSWAATWPKLAATVLLLGLWQAVVWSGWRPPYVLPGPDVALTRVWQTVLDGTLLAAVTTTSTRAVIGFSTLPL
jgi:NitT/TauT family transport system permease protein